MSATPWYFCRCCGYGLLLPPCIFARHIEDKERPPLKAEATKERGDG